MGSRAEPIEGVDIILTKPDGVHGDPDHREGRQVRLHGHRARQLPLVGVDEETLPEGSELRPPASAALRGPDGTIKVDNVVLGQELRAGAWTVRAADFDDETRASWRSSSSPASTASGSACCWRSPASGLSLIYGDQASRTSRTPSR